MINFCILPTNKFYQAETMREVLETWYNDTNNPEYIPDDDDLFYSLIIAACERTYNMTPIINDDIPVADKDLIKSCSFVFWLEEVGELEIDYSKSINLLESKIRDD